jgi:U3 small nucleolar RNA-associated protein 20
VFTSEKVDLWKVIERLLMCEQVGIRLVSSRLFGNLFGRAESSEDGKLKIEALNVDIRNLATLAGQFLEQIKSGESTSEIGLQAVKNLIFLGRHFYQTKCILPKSKEAENDGGKEPKSCFAWLLSRVAAEIRYERVVAEVCHQ